HHGARRQHAPHDRSLLQGSGPHAAPGHRAQRSVTAEHQGHAVSATLPEVVIVDGGGANIASLKLALQRLGYAGRLSSDAASIRAAERVILPGVGAARAAMERLKNA